MDQKLKITIYAKKHDGNKLEKFETLAVMAEGENVDELVQMIYGCWYNIVEYFCEPIDIFVSEKYCHKISAEFLKQNTK